MIEITDIEEEKLQKKRKKKRHRIPNDKILDNNYNTGNILFEPLSKPVIDENFKNCRLTEYYNSYDYENINSLNDLIGGIYEKTIWYETYGISQRIPKQYLSEIYSYIRSNIRNNPNYMNYSEIDIFNAIANNLDLNEFILYHKISNYLQVLIISELENSGYKKNIQTYNKVAKLF